MGWIQDLYKTYQKAEAQVGIEDEKDVYFCRLPIQHKMHNWKFLLIWMGILKAPGRWRRQKR